MKKDFFTSASEAMNRGEKSFLDFLSAIVPYFVPVIPAYLTYYHTIEQMGFPTWVAATTAFVVEVLGLASVSTAIRFWRNNTRYSDKKNKAPFWLAVGVYVFYIVVVLTVNVVLEGVSGTRSGWIVLSIALFSLLSFPSGILISIRVQFAEMLEERGSRYHKVAQGETEDRQPRSRRPKFASKFRPQILEMLNTAYADSGRVLTPKEITAKLNLDHERSKGFVSTLTKTWKQEKGIDNEKRLGF